MESGVCSLEKKNKNSVFSSKVLFITLTIFLLVLTSCSEQKMADDTKQIDAKETNTKETLETEEDAQKAVKEVNKELTELTDSLTDLEESLS